MHEILNNCFVVLKRDLRVHIKRNSELLSVMIFFIIIISLFPLAYGPLPSDLIWLVPGIIWIAALLSILLAQDNLLRTDYQIGIYEQLIISPYSFYALLLAKILANWLVTGLPLVIITPLLAQSFALPFNTIMVLTLSLLLGTPTLSLIGALGAALTLSLPRGGLLLAILTLPLYIPVLVLGTATSMLSLRALNSNGGLALLAALAIASILFSPMALKALIKVSIT